PPGKQAAMKECIDIIAAMKMYVPDVSQLLLDSADPIPDPAPHFTIGRTGRGTRFYAVPMFRAVPNTEYYGACGFEVGFAQSTVHTAQETWNEVGRMLKSHDQKTVSHLILTVGGPDPWGFSFRSDHQLVMSMLAAS